MEDEDFLKEKTLVLIKPDAVLRGIAGEVIRRLEQTGLKMVACKMLKATHQQIDGHLPQSEEWLRKMGEKVTESCEKYALDVVEIMGIGDTLAIGKIMKKWIFNYLSIGPVVVAVFQGNHAVDIGRKIVGHTSPLQASPGTIRGDLSSDSSDLAIVVGSPAKNLVHASDTTKEAEREISNWFAPEELMDYKRTDEFLLFLGEFNKS